MSKLFWSTLLITSVATGLGVIPIARSQTTQTTGNNTLSQFPVAPDPQVEPPVCFFTSTGGRTFDLEALCGVSNTNPNNPNNSATNNSPDPGNTTTANDAPLNTPANNVPNNNQPIVSSPNQSTGDQDLGPLTKPAINLPNVPPSAFSPGGVAPTRQSIDGNNPK